MILIKKEILYEMFEMFIEMRKPLTLRDLQACGLGGYDIDELLSASYLKREKDGSFNLACADALYDYGRILAMENQHFRALKCYSLCIKIDPNHVNTYIELLIIALESGQYKKFRNYFKKIYSSKVKEDPQTWDFYLYLISFSFKLDNDLRKRACATAYRACQLSPDDEKASMRNVVISRAFLQRWSYAIHGLYDLNAKYGPTRESYFVYCLLRRAEEAKQNRMSIITEFINEKNYEGIKTLLEEEVENHKCSAEDFALLKISRDIIEMLNTEIPVVPYQEACLDTLDAIRRKNYILAKELNDKRIKSTDLIDLNLTKALDDICDVIISLSQSGLSIESSEEKTISEVDLEKYYENKNIKNILDALESGIEIQKACKLFGSSVQEQGIALLLFAKNKYKNSKFTEGDKIMRVILTYYQPKKFIKKLFDYVRDNRNTFAVSDKSLTMKPIENK